MSITTLRILWKLLWTSGNGQSVSMIFLVIKSSFPIIVHRKKITFCNENVYHLWGWTSLLVIGVAFTGCLNCRTRNIQEYEARQPVFALLCFALLCFKTRSLVTQVGLAVNSSSSSLYAKDWESRHAALVEVDFWQAGWYLLCLVTLLVQIESPDFRGNFKHSSPF